MTQETHDEFISINGIASVPCDLIAEDQAVIVYDTVHLHPTTYLRFMLKNFGPDVAFETLQRMTHKRIYRSFNASRNAMNKRIDNLMASTL